MANVIFIPGFGFDPEIWKEQVDLLSNSGHQVFAANLPHKKNLDEMAHEFLSELACDEIDGEIILVGWSVGGMLALKIAALDAQNAGHNKIVKLVLVSTTPKFCQQDEWKFGILKETLLDLKNRIAANYESGMNYFYDFIGSEFSRQENLNSWDQKRALSVINLLEKEDLRPILSQIQIPTLIISSEEDQICLPGASRYLAKNISGAKYVIFPSSHAPFLTSPERFSSLIADFAGESSINVR